MTKVFMAAIAVFPILALDQLNGLIALCALGVAAMAIHALVKLARDRRE